MKRYAIKIGEIIVSSENPVTEEQRKKATEYVASGRLRIDVEPGVTVELSVNGH